MLKIRWLALPCTVAIVAVAISLSNLQNQKSPAATETPATVPAGPASERCAADEAAAAVASSVSGRKKAKSRRNRTGTGNDGPLWHEMPGFDVQGRVYSSPADLWAKVAEARLEGDPSSGLLWYGQNMAYWDNQEPSDSAMVGGHDASLDTEGTDLRGSAAFVRKVMGAAIDEAAAGKRRLVALDCGAGVGRVAEALLLHNFQEVDLVEPSAHLLAKAKERLSRTDLAFPPSHRAANFFQAGLEAFDPEPGRYDVMWMQWAITYLTDDDAVAFLRRCAAALRPGGVILVKENVCTSEGYSFVVQNGEASIIRSNSYNKALFTNGTGLRVVHSELQPDWPKNLVRLRMYALERGNSGEGEQQRR